MEPRPAQPHPSPLAQVSRSWDGFFINLDRSPERRRRIEQQLSTLGIADCYKRFQAVDGRQIAASSPCSRGEVGLYRSHLDILESSAASGRAVHIMEDDVILCDLTVPAIDGAVRKRVIDKFDILFLETYVAPTLESMRAFHARYEKKTANQTIVIGSPEQLQIMDLQDQYLFGTTSYLVGAKRISRVLSVLRRAWRLGPALPLDLVIQHAVRARELRVGCFFPFVSTIDLELSQASTTKRGESADGALVRQILRYSFFVRRDLRGHAAPALARALERRHRPDPDGAVDLYLNVLRYYLSKPVE